jgi:hypothetical protein
LPVSAAMTSNFESTMTEAEFTRPLLNPEEERVAREMQKESDFAVDGLKGSLLSRLLTLFGLVR